MVSLELREEIKYAGGSYFLQTSYIPDQKKVVSSFFRDGVLFDSLEQGFTEEPKPEELREITKSVHNTNKKNFRFILDTRDRIRRNPDPTAHLKLAQALAMRNLNNEAIEEAENAISKGMKDSSPYAVIGKAYFELEDYDKAQGAIKKGIELSPDFPDLHNLIGKIYLKRNMCGPAVASFKKAINLNLYYGEPYLNLARSYLLNTILKEDYEISKDLHENFESNLKRAVQLNPFIDAASIDKARKLFSEEAYQEALDILDNIKLNSTRDYVDEIILELYLTILQSGEAISDGDIEGYMAMIDRIIDQNPTFADAYNSLGILYTAKCKILMDKASNAFSKALEINEKYEKARKNLRLMENDRQGIFILLKALLD